MFEKIIAKVVNRLNSAKRSGYLEDFALIGGLAVARWGPPRATQDIDFVVKLPRDQLNQTAKFLKAQLRFGDIRDPIMSSMTITERDKLGPITVQLIQFPPSWEKVAFEHVVREKLRKIQLPIVGWKALILLKLYAGGPVDLQDAKSILETISPRKEELNDLKQQASALRISKRLSGVLALKD